jgi:hypothetical protein
MVSNRSFNSSSAVNAGSVGAFSYQSRKQGKRRKEKGKQGKRREEKGRKGKRARTNETKIQVHEHEGRCAYVFCQVEQHLGRMYRIEPCLKCATSLPLQFASNSNFHTNTSTRTYFASSELRLVHTFVLCVVSKSKCLQ